MAQKHFVLLLLLCIGCFVNCSKTKESDSFIGFVKPAHFPSTQYSFENNVIQKEKFALGKRLFYDPVLSRNNTISCASCHIQAAGFTQHGHSVSHGIEDLLGTRNSPPIMNLAWNNSFMWDGGILDLDLLPIAPITNHVEMGETMENVLSKLNNNATYRSQFQDAFGTTKINSTTFLKALSQFMLLCVSSNAKYDSVMLGQSVFSEEEKRGYYLFQEKCNACHKEPLFTDFSFRNNGLTPSVLNDVGRNLVSLEENDKYKFKVPSLRNLDYTPPYMHDGRLLTINSVLEHYRSGVTFSSTLDPLLQKNTTLGISLGTDEKAVLIAFLKTLNDKTFITNKTLSEEP